MSTQGKAWLAFIALLLAGAVAGVAGHAVVAGRYTKYEIHTDEVVSGLIADAPVEFHGVDVGRVKRVELRNPRSVRIVFEVQKDAPVTRATVATITARGLASRGFTGYVVVALEDVGADSRPLASVSGEDYPVVPNAPSRSVSLDMAVNQVNENVRALTEIVQAALDARTMASFKASVDSLQKISTTLAENDQRLTTIVANTEQASRQFAPLLDTSTTTLRVLQAQVLPQAYQSLASLNQLSLTLRRAAAKMDRDPSVLVRGSAALPPGPGESP